MRGEGLLLGLKAKVPVAGILQAMCNEKLLCVSASDNVIRLTPPLNIQYEELNEALRRFDRALLLL